MGRREDAHAESDPRSGFCARPLSPGKPVEEAGTGVKIKPVSCPEYEI